jgi:hypothetical protein
MDHFLIAIACLVLTAISLVMSFVYGWPLFQEFLAGR